MFNKLKLVIIYVEWEYMHTITFSAQFSEHCTHSNLTFYDQHSGFKVNKYWWIVYIIWYSMSK